MIQLLTVAGTIGRWWEGYPADTGRALIAENDWKKILVELTGEKNLGPKWFWQGCEYPSATFPMRPSILEGWEEVVRQAIRIFTTTDDSIVLEGYSQGAIVICMVWREEFLNPAGRLHKWINRCFGLITQGNPMRCPGIAYGNLIAGQKIPGKLNGYTTGGIAGPTNLRPEECLFPFGHPWAGTPAVLDFALDGDLYAAAPVGDKPWEKETEVGANQTLIYEAILDFNGKDIMALGLKVFKIVTMPMTQILPLLQAMWGAVSFFGKGVGAPHWQYRIDAAVRHLEQIGRENA